MKKILYVSAMQITQHADRSEQRVGLRAEDIHQWIDDFFDRESFDAFQRSGQRPDYDPYTHRKYRHCTEALEDAYTIFSTRYTREQIQAVLECHIRDDYQGYMPSQEDFENGTFTERFHEHGGEELEKILSEAELTEYFKGSAYPTTKNPRLSTGFYWRIVWPTVIAAILFAVSSFTIIVPVFRQNMMTQKKEMIRELTQTAASAIAFYIHQEQNGFMTREAAQAEAAAEISELRYGDDRKDYFWITDMYPIMIMHPYRPELTGCDLTRYTDTEDKSGKKLFVEFVHLIEQNHEGYLNYEWQWKDDATRTAPKLSYVLEIPEWKWIIGTGIYIDDVDREIAALAKNLWVADSIVALILLTLLGNVLYQSRRIEHHRARAENGLREAKDRYRALVEASAEGSLLEVDGATLYSNQALRNMTGYSEHELEAMPLHELLAPGQAPNWVAAQHFETLSRGDSSSAGFEAVLKTKEGRLKEVWISTARIFFSEKQGHALHFSSLARSQEDTLRGFHASTPSVASEAPLEHLNATLRDCKSAGEIIQTLNDFPLRIRILTDQGIRPELLRYIIGSTFDTAIKRFAQLITQPHAEVPFAVLSLGSSARHEMTLFSDQDNALIFGDVPPAQLTEIRRAFLQFSDTLCGRIKQAGWPYCPGGIMAVNPKWCLSLSEWKAQFNHWIGAATPQSILEVNVFLDIRCAYGDDSLVQLLRDHIHELTRQNPEFLIHYARNCLQYKAPITLFGHLKTKQNDGRKTINIKQSLKPIETFARIYALKHALPEVGTFERIQKLQEIGVVQEQTVREMTHILNHLWQLRFFNQLLTEDCSINDEVDIDRLTEIERQTLQNVLSQVSTFQTKLSYDFLGVDAS